MSLWKAESIRRIQIETGWAITESFHRSIDEELPPYQESKPYSERIYNMPCFIKDVCYLQGIVYKPRLHIFY